ncbi:hypothetical protein A5791_14525 [Mycobacterium sp. 852002-51163_SCH5372311]|nr:hypothetical protein A5791_14525 [Mycobacterium sp. 852002-51163_SCH5372311]
MASPVRVSLASELGGELDGAWWPHTVALGAELPELADSLFPRLGRLLDISINWSSLASSPDLDSLCRPLLARPCRPISQRVMTISGTKTRATLIVIPSRTSVVLAVMILRCAAGLHIASREQIGEPFLTADQIVRSAAAEGARCAQRLRELDPSAAAPRLQP